MGTRTRVEETEVDKGSVIVTRSEPLHLKYRPQEFDQVTGHAAAVKAFKRSLKDSQAFMLTGPAGTGKTTLARLGAKHLGIEPHEVLEIDAATNSGIDHMRVLQNIIRYRPLGGTRRAVIIDEAHGLSKQAWDSLLKVVEEPPEHLIWFLCTTNASKIPATIKSRCTPIPLQAIAPDQLADLLDEIAEIEKIDLPDGVASICIKEANGSARQLLVNLATVRGVKNREAAAKLLRSSVESDPVIALCRGLLQGIAFNKAVRLVADCEGQTPEGIRRVVNSYMSAVMKGTRSDRDAGRLLDIMDAFERPFYDDDSMAPLYLAIGRVLLAPK